MAHTTEDLLQNLSKKLVKGVYLRRNLPEGGKLLVDRHLPFLCVYRFEAGAKDENIAHLVKGQASYLIISQALQDLYGPLVEIIAQNRLEMFDAFFLLEIWPATESETSSDTLPQFKIFCPTSTAQSTVQELEKGLEKLKSFVPTAEIIIECSHTRGPEGLPPLIHLETGKELGLLVLGLEVPPVYWNSALEVSYPLLLQKIKRVITETIKKTIFEFTQVQTSTDFTHYLMLGGRGLQPTVQYIDKKLVQIHESVNFLLEVTPVNLDKAYEEFQKSGFEKKPRFNYRLIATNPDILKRELYQIPVERIEDVTFSYLLREKRNELDTQISMIETRNTPNFLYNSLRVYGKPDKKLYDTAKGLLSTLPDPENGQSSNGYLDCHAFAHRSEKEITYLHQKNTVFHPKVEIRKDVSGLMVSRDRLLIGETTQIPENRVEALLQHEIGTHLLTYFNGAAQPLQLLKSGLAGYEELQEGLAVLAEYLVGGLNYSRLRILAARVIAAQALTEGATFVDTFRELHQEYGFSTSTAFNVTARIFRGGGLTKDIVYLRGLVNLLGILNEEINFEHLFVGKIGFKHVHYVDELMYRQVITPPLVLPKYLSLAPAKKRLSFIQKKDVTLIDLLNTEI
jgi:uncharacterized protein (TIGR02421 family)